MTRPIVFGAAAIMLFALGIVAANTRIAQGVIPVTPYEADVNKDARVNVADVGLVAKRFGQPVPTATPISSPPQVTKNRAFASRFAPPGNQLPTTIELVNTDTGSIIEAYPNGYSLGTSGISCDGKYAVLDLSSTDPSHGGEISQTIIETASGAVVAETADFPQGQISVTRNRFPCPIKNSVAPPRVVLARISPAGFRIDVLNLSNGSTVFTDSEVDGNGFTLTCSQDAIVYSTLSETGADGLKIVRLVDGVVVGTYPASAYIEQSC